MRNAENLEKKILEATHISLNTPEMHGSNGENFEGNCSEDKSMWITLYPYQVITEMEEKILEDEGNIVE